MSPAATSAADTLTGMARFDPDTGRLLTPLDDIQVSAGGRSTPRSRVEGNKRITETVHPDTGKVDGFVTEHASGRQDCNVFAPPVVVERPTTT